MAIRFAADDATSTTTAAPPAEETEEFQDFLESVGANATPEQVAAAQSALQNLDLTRLASLVTPILEQAAGENGMLQSLLEQLKDPQSMEEATELLRSIGGDENPLGKLSALAEELAKGQEKVDDLL